MVEFYQYSIFNHNFTIKTIEAAVYPEGILLRDGTVIPSIVNLTNCTLGKKIMAFFDTHELIPIQFPPSYVYPEKNKTIQASLELIIRQAEGLEKQIHSLKEKVAHALSSENLLPDLLDEYMAVEKLQKENNFSEILVAAEYSVNSASVRNGNHPILFNIDVINPKTNERQAMEAQLDTGAEISVGNRPILSKMGFKTGKTVKLSGIDTSSLTLAKATTVLVVIKPLNEPELPPIKVKVAMVENTDAIGAGTPFLADVSFHRHAAEHKVILL
jgi:hypothetical protein